MTLPDDVRLVTDDRGVREFRVGATTYGLRPDLEPEFLHAKAFLHAMPRGKHKNYLEDSLAGSLVSRIERRASPQAPRTGRIKTASREEQRRYFAVRSEARRVANWAINEVRAVADQSALRRAYRFIPTERLAVYWTAVKHPRMAQLLDAFPMLGAKICTERDHAEREELLDMVRYGEPIGAIAEAAGVPLAVKKVHPSGFCDREAACWVGEVYPDLIHAFLPRHFVRQRRWLSALGAFRYTGAARQVDDFFDAPRATPERNRRVCWVAKHAPVALPQAELSDQVIAVCDWIVGENIDAPKMSWASALAQSESWHRNAQFRRHAELTKPFPAPWLPGDVVRGYEIIPLVSGGELADEGAAMHHCVGSYASYVVSGRAYIYSVRKDGKRLATLQLELQNESGERHYRIAQLKAACNNEPERAVRTAALRWLNQHTQPAAQVAAE